MRRVARAKVSFKTLDSSKDDGQPTGSGSQVTELHYYTYTLSAQIEWTIWRICVIWSIGQLFLSLSLFATLSDAIPLDQFGINSHRSDYRLPRLVRTNALVFYSFISLKHNLCNTLTLFWTFVLQLDLVPLFVAASNDNNHLLALNDQSPLTHTSFSSAMGTTKLSQIDSQRDSVPLTIWPVLIIRI